MKIVISIINGLSFGLYMQKYEPMLFPIDLEGDRYAMAGFSGLCIHLGFIQIQIGEIEIPKE